MQRVLAVMLVAVALHHRVAAAQPTESKVQGVTLEAALQLAGGSPAIRALAAEVEAAKGRRVSAGLLPFNPVLGGTAARRTSETLRSSDHEIELSQELEIGGQRGKRVRAANAALSGAEATYQRERELVLARVATAFAEALRARDALAIERADVAAADDLLRLSELRSAAGKAADIEVNLARAAAGRARGRVELAQGAYFEARAGLAVEIGASPAAPPEPLGELAAPPPLPRLDELVRQALAQRPDLKAAEFSQEAARAEIALADAAALPNLVASAFSAREANTDRIRGAGLSLGIPLFNRNQGQRAEVRALADQAAARLAIAKLEVERDVASAYSQYTSARAASEGLRSQVVGTLEENLHLLETALDAGKIGRTEVFLFRREFVESQREYLDALVETWKARSRLALAVGEPQSSLAERIQ